MYLLIFKTIVGTVTSAGVYTVAKQVVKVSAPIVMSKKEAILMKIGGVVLPIVLGGTAGKFVEEIIDSGVEYVELFQKAFRGAIKEMEKDL